MTSLGLSRHHGEILCGLALAAGGIAFAIAANSLPPGDPGVPGPGAAPLALGVLLTIAGVYAVVRGTLRARKQQQTEIDWRALLAMGLLAAASLAFEPLGFVAVSMLFLTFGFRWLGAISWIRSAAVAAVFTAIVWFVFLKLLGVGLPAGMLEFLLGP